MSGAERCSRNHAEQEMVRRILPAGAGESEERSLPLEDRALKYAAQFFGSMEDFNFEMEDGTWRHFEFESDSITESDLRRFRAYEAVTSYYYAVDVETCVICTASVRRMKSELKTGKNRYRIRVIRMSDTDADQVMRDVEKKRRRGVLKRADLIQLLLTPLMGGDSSVSFRIEQGIRLLHAERDRLEKEDLLRMESIFYAFVMKFVSGDKLQYLREVLKMTILGQMLFDDGRQEGRQEGHRDGIRVLIETCQELGSSREDTLVRLTEKFSLHPEAAAECMKQYWK